MAMLVVTCVVTAVSGARVLIGLSQRRIAMGNMTGHGDICRRSAGHLGASFASGHHSALGGRQSGPHAERQHDQREKRRQPTSTGPGPVHAERIDGPKQ